MDITEIKLTDAGKALLRACLVDIANTTLPVAVVKERINAHMARHIAKSAGEDRQSLDDARKLALAILDASRPVGSFAGEAA